MLWFSFVAYAVLTLSFGIVMQVWDFVIIDEMFDQAQIRAHIEAMTLEQRSVHALLTSTVDVAYPFAYATFQAGMAYRYLGRWGRWIALLSIVCVPVDLLEGFAQVMLLQGNEPYMALKLIATPVKLALFIPGFLGALIAVGFAVRQRPQRAD